MYVAGRSNLRLMGKLYSLGDPVDISEVPLRKVGSLARLGLLIEQPGVVEVPEAPAEPEAEAEDQSENSGDLCPLCGEGPFMNMKIHTSRMHKEEEPSG